MTTKWLRLYRCSKGTIFDIKIKVKIGLRGIKIYAQVPKEDRKKFGPGYWIVQNTTINDEVYDFER